MVIFTELSKQHKKKMIFVNVPGSENQVMEYFGVKTVPTYAVANMTEAGSVRKYILTGELTKSAISSHLQDFFDRKLTPTLKSEEPEPTDVAGHVTGIFWMFSDV